MSYASSCIKYNANPNNIDIPEMKIKNPIDVIRELDFCLPFPPRVAIAESCAEGEYENQ